MEVKTVDSYRLDIHIAGDVAVIEQACREYCHAVGLCVTVQPQRFIYTGGQEDGARIGLLNYPRFPTERDALWDKARDLVHRLLDRACQLSVLIEARDRTEWISLRDENPAAK